MLSCMYEKLTQLFHEDIIRHFSYKKIIYFDHILLSEIIIIIIIMMMIIIIIIKGRQCKAVRVLTSYESEDPGPTTPTNRNQE